MTSPCSTLEPEEIQAKVSVVACPPITRQGQRGVDSPATTAAATTPALHHAACKPHTWRLVVKRAQKESLQAGGSGRMAA